MTAHDRVQGLIAERLPQHLDLLRDYMAIPSTLGDAAGVRRAAEFLAAQYRALGCQVAEVVETPSLPAVWASYDAGAARTLAVYGYLDTNGLGSGWTVEPYQGVVAAHPAFPRVLYGRGAASKGGALAFLQALRAIRDAEGELPINLLFLIEGEEFLGSPFMPDLIKRYEPQLARADAVIWPGPSQAANGDVALFLGNKGLLKLEITCSSASWGRGPMGAAAHSSTQGVLDSPTWRLVHALATLYDPKTGRILVDGFTEGLSPPTPEEDALLDQLAALYRGREASAVPGIGPRATVSRFLGDAEGREVFRRYCFEPTMNIDGLAAGMTGPGTPAWTLPEVARCTIDHRLPPDIDPDACLARIRSHLDRQGYPDIGLRVLGAVGSQKLPVEHDLVRAARAALSRRGIEPTIWPCRGTSGPTGHFSAILGKGVLGATGLGYASGHSGPDEFLVIEGDGRVGGLTELVGSLADLVLDYASGA
ncbi:M20/M25/M40 family metallo-hydrolase [Falsiroseomonas sp. HC035]|uniref:M20/M25/M40 family metallo-hydrolase n=1 Tax=Falsiroseomonas sp. HC035 TaxID=3390999 RepID=UPI003D320C4F